MIDITQLRSGALAGLQRFMAAFPNAEATSGRRNLVEQAHDDAINILASNRNFIRNTYLPSTASKAVQFWIDANPSVTSLGGLASGILSVLQQLTDDELALFSKHLSGDAFDIRPTDDPSMLDFLQTIVDDFTHSGTPARFLSQENGLRRWHVQIDPIAC